MNRGHRQQRAKHTRLRRNDRRGSNVTFILEKHAASSGRKESNMSKKTDYSAEEWKAISGAPVAAGLLIKRSDASGPIGIAKEGLAVGRAIRESASGDDPAIVQPVAESGDSGGGRRGVP